MADANTQSALPGAMRARLAALEAESTPPSGEATTPTPAVVTPPAAPATPAAPVTPPAGEGTVTLSREEYNQLQADAGKTQRALAQAETERLRAEETAHRLTELEKAAKSVPDPSPAAPALPVETVDFTADEEKEYGDSREFITKVVKQQLAPALAKINDLIRELRGEITSAKQTATDATQQVRKSSERQFFDQVKAAVPNLATIKSHKNWPDFLDETDDLAGVTYEQLLAHNVQRENLAPVVNIYKKFTDKYLKTDTSVAGGYAGGTPSGAAVTPPVAKPDEGKLKQSDRAKASVDYRKGKITWDELQTVNKKFEEAEKAGNIDYNA